MDPLKRLIAKFYVFFGSLSLFYELCSSFYRKYILEADRVSAAIFLPQGTSPNIQKSLLDLLSKGQDRFIIFGDGKHPLKCDKIVFDSDTAFAYLNITTARANQNIAYPINQCDYYENTAYRGIDLINYWVEYTADSIQHMLEQKILGRTTLYWEIFGSRSGLAAQNATNLELNGVIVTHSSRTHIAFTGVTDELLLRLFTDYERNLYIRFINNILLNPDDSSISINSSKGITSFFVDISDTICSNSSVIDWQNSQTQQFLRFYKATRETKLETKQDAFMDHFSKQEQFPDWYLKFQEENLFRFKELLLFNTIIRNSTDQASCLIANDVNINSQLLNGATPLIAASSIGNVIFVHLFIANGADVNMANSNKITALMTASYQGYPDVVKILLENSTIDAQDSNLYTSLMHACLMGHTEVVKILTHAGANPNIMNIRGQTALYIAIKLNKEDIASILLSAGANPFLHTNSYFEYEIEHQNALERIINLCVKNYCSDAVIVMGCVSLLNNELSSFYSYPSKTIGDFLTTNHVDGTYNECVIEMVGRLATIPYEQDFSKS